MTTLYYALLSLCCRINARIRTRFVKKPSPPAAATAPYIRSGDAYSWLFQTDARTQMVRGDIWDRITERLPSRYRPVGPLLSVLAAQTSPELARRFHSGASPYVPRSQFLAIHRKLPASYTAPHPASLSVLRSIPVSARFFDRPSGYLPPRLLRELESVLPVSYRIPSPVMRTVFQPMTPGTLQKKLSAAVSKPVYIAPGLKDTLLRRLPPHYMKRAEEAANAMKPFEASRYAALFERPAAGTLFVREAVWQSILSQVPNGYEIPEKSWLKKEG